MLATQIIGWPLIVLSDIPLKWHEIPIIGLSGFLMAGVMGWWDLPIPFSFELTFPVLTDSANSPFSRLDMTMVVAKPALHLSFVLNCIKKGRGKEV